MATIICVAGKGTGETKIGAFHSALESAGVGRFNLIRLSSVVPPGWSVKQAARVPSGWGKGGDLLYCVTSEVYVKGGATGGAALGWINPSQQGDVGYFAEAVGSSAESASLEAQIALREMCKSANLDYVDGDGCAIEVTSSAHMVSCGVVIAVFGTVDPSGLQIWEFSDILSASRLTKERNA